MTTEKEFDLREFRDFCASKPSNETFPAANIHQCAFAQFGFHSIATSEAVTQLGLSHTEYSTIVNGEATFGALTKRLEALIEQRQA